MPNIVTCLTPGTQSDRALTGLLGASERFGKSIGERHTVIVGAQDGSAAKHAKQHADEVVMIEDQEYVQYQPESCLAILARACSDLAPQFVFLNQDTYSQELSARLAKRLGGCSLGDAQSVEIVEGKVRVKRSVYGGKAVAIVQANNLPAVVWLRARAFSGETPRDSLAAVVEKKFLTEGESDSFPAVTVVARQKEASTGVKLEDAQVIVSGGRGLGGPEPFAKLEELAEVMQAQVAASRAACDSGWVPAGYQVGQTGKKVAPELYLAIALSGASQHLMGISDAKVVAAINTDPDAPIFRRCQFGLVEDWKNVVGPLTEQLRQLKG